MVQIWRMPSRWGSPESMQLVEPTVLCQTHHMALPNGAKLEAVLGGALVIYDVAHLLPTNPKSKKVYRRRSPGGIRYAIVHKSGADGPAGYRGAEGSARYVTRKRGWPGAAYTYWLSREPDVTEQGRVIYRCHGDSVRSFHTGGRMNTLGVGIGVQGNYDGDGDASPTRSRRTSRWTRSAGSSSISSSATTASRPRASSTRTWAGA